MFGVWFWESFIGLGYDVSHKDNFPLALTAIFWPISVPILLLMSLHNWLGNVKKRRVKREKDKYKLRIKLDREMDEYLSQIEAELESGHLTFKSKGR